jgi:hypothetical protein
VRDEAALDQLAMEHHSQLFKGFSMSTHETFMLNIVYRKLDQLQPRPQNARTHSMHQIRQIADSIRVFGFTNPILIDSRNRIIAGHGRVEAATFGQFAKSV